MKSISNLDPFITLYIKTRAEYSEIEGFSLPLNFIWPSDFETRKYFLFLYASGVSTPEDIIQLIELLDIQKRDTFHTVNNDLHYLSASNDLSIYKKILPELGMKRLLLNINNDAITKVETGMDYLISLNANIMYWFDN